MNYPSLATIGVRLIAVHWLFVDFFSMLRLPSEFALFHGNTPAVFSFFMDTLIVILQATVAIVLFCLSRRLGSLIAKGLI
jgi:hypothetical protein